MIVDDLDWYSPEYSLVELGVSLTLFLPSNSFIFFLPVFFSSAGHAFWLDDVY